MDENELMLNIISSFCDAMEMEYFSKKAVIDYVKTESKGKTYQIQRSIIRVHDLIHTFENEHLQDLNIKHTI